MKCKNCIHNVICSANAYFKQIDDCEKNCCHFKDKSLIVELPCKAGDKVYVFKPHFKRENDKIVTDFTVEETDVRDVKVVFTVSGVQFIASDFGEYVFLTRDEAEKKLEEIKKTKEIKNEN